MGRGRLRRGYSLEVIFEEDSELGSALNSLDSFALHGTASAVGRRSSIQEEFSTQEDYCTESRSSTHLNFSSLLTSTPSGRSSNSLESTHNRRRSGPCELTAPATATGHHSLAAFADPRGFKSLNGFLQASDMDACYIEWDEFSGDSLMSKSGASAGFGDIDSRNACANGRRSRVSRRQIVEANWLVDDEEDGDHDRDYVPVASSTGPSSVYCPPPPPINPISTPASMPSPEGDTDDIFRDRAASFTAADAAFFDHDPCGGGSASLLLTDETYAAIDTFDDVNSTISTTTTTTRSLSSSGINLNGSSDKQRDSSFSPNASSATTTATKSSISINYERPNLNSSVSPASSLSASSYANGKQEIMQQKSSSTDSDSHSPTPMPDVKRVRALFENSCNNLNTGSEPESTISSSSPFSTWKKASPSSGPSPVLKKTCPQLLSTSKTSLLSVEDRSGSDLNLSTSSCRSTTGSSPLIRSAYSQLQLNQMEKYDFVDLLVNDNIIIEDSPDLFQKQRSRLQDMDRVKVSQSNRLTPDSSTRHSSLRRSKSVGGGLHKRDNYDADESSSNEDVHKSRPCILAEELPAPDTVKNVRNVFEKLLHKKASSSDPPAVIITPLHHKASAYTNSIESSAKKSLSSVKSNPTSKILRSESMRDDSIKHSRYGKPILLNGHLPPLPATVSPPKANELENKAKKVEALRNGVHKNLVNGNGRKPVESTTEMKRDNTNRQPQKRAFEIGKRTDSFPTFNQRRDIHYYREQDSLLSVGSSLGTIVGDDEEPRMISPDVLNKIRSCGTTTTYFGGEIVAKTIQNRNLILPPVKLETNPQDEVDFAVAPPSDIIFTARPNQDDKTSPKSSTPERNRQNNHATRNGSGIDFASFRFMEFESPSSRLSRHPDDEDIPRIISVEPKSQPNSPTKSNSPIGTMMGSIIAEGRNSPEGCESNASVSSSLGTSEQSSRTEGWINKHGDGTGGAEDTTAIATAARGKKGDGNNNCIKPPVSAETTIVTNGHGDHDGDENENSAVSSKKFSEAAEGAWF